MTENQKNESPESLPKSLVLAKLLEQTDDVEEIEKQIASLFESIESDIGRTFTSDVGLLYREMNEQKCLARIEQLSRILEIIENNKSLSISDENESHYANAVVPVEAGLKIAFSEGQAPGPVRAVVAFGKTLIGFKTEHLTVEGIDFNESEIRNIAERKHVCRHVSGFLEKDDITHLIMRVPTKLFPKKLLIDDERKRNPVFIFRGMSL